MHIFCSGHDVVDFDGCAAKSKMGTNYKKNQ